VDGLSELTKIPEKGKHVLFIDWQKFSDSSSMAKGMNECIFTLQIFWGKKN